MIEPETFLTGLGAFVAGVLGAAGPFWVVLRKQRRLDQASEQDRDVRVWSELKEIIAWQGKQIRRGQQQVDTLQALVHLLDQDRSDCQVLMADLYGHLRHHHEITTRHAEALRRLQQEPGPVPKLPARPEQDNAAREFQRRTLEQNLKLLKERDSHTQEPSHAEVEADSGSGG